MPHVRGTLYIALVVDRFDVHGYAVPVSISGTGNIGMREGPSQSLDTASFHINEGGGRGAGALTTRLFYVSCCCRALGGSSKGVFGSLCVSQ